MLANLIESKFMPRGVNTLLENRILRIMDSLFLESLTQLLNRVGASRIIITVSRNKTRDIVTNLFMATYSIYCILTHSANMLLANKILLNE